MSVVSTDLVIYTAANMPEDNASLTGGDINSGIRASFDDLSTPSRVVVYSASGTDTSQNLTVVGRTSEGTIISETVSLAGTTHVFTSYTYGRVLSAVLNASAIGSISVSGNTINNLSNIPVGEYGFRRPFYDATARVEKSKTYYEKLFVKNNNTSAALTDAKIVEVNDGLASKIDFGLEDSKKSNQTVTNRETAPTGIGGGFGSGPSGIMDDLLLVNDYQGMWVKLSLGAGEAATNSFYEVQISGTTV